jgi:hypothetical protein
MPYFDFRDGFFYRDVLAKEQADLEELGSLSGQLTLILGIGAVLTFVLVAAGTRSLGKVRPSFPLSSPQPQGNLTFVLVAASTRSLGKVRPSFPLSSPQPQGNLIFVLVAACTCFVGVLIEF